MPDCNDIFPLSCNTFKALNRHMRSNEINNWITSIHSSPLSSQACRGGSMCQIFIFGFCLCQRPETIVDLKLFSLFADAANSRTDRTVAKGILMLFFFIFTLFLFSPLNITDFLKLLCAYYFRNAKNLKINIPKNREQCGSNCRSVDKLT